MGYFYKKRENDKIWWYRREDQIGPPMFSFDKVKIYNVYADYPHNLTKAQKEMFDKENPYWEDLLKSRCNNGKK